MRSDLDISSTRYSTKQYDQTRNFFFSNNINYHQNYNAYFEFDKTTWKVAVNPADANFVDPDDVRWVENDFAYTFKQATLSTTREPEIEIIKCICHFS